MRYLPFKPLLDYRPFFWDDDDWQETTGASGINVYIDDKETVVTVEAPVAGLEPKDVKVTYHDGMLHIYGSNSEKDEEKKKGQVVKKWQMATSYDYVTSLPRPIDAKTVDAKVKNGVITIKAKVAEESKPKEIEVKVG